MGLTETSSVAMLDAVFVLPAQWDVDKGVVWLRGEHDLSTIPALSEIVHLAIAHDDADLVLDLSEMLFIDAATVGTIVRMRVFLKRRSRSLSLRAPSACARRVLDLCGLADLIATDSIEETTLPGGAAALASWVAVPATDLVDSPEVSPPKSTHIPETEDADLDPAEQPEDADLDPAEQTVLSADSRLRSTECPTKLATREGG